ncbi:MAG: hypothetical protein AAGF67_07980, partial [Verrucomicrobiota bacterium]
MSKSGHRMSRVLSPETSKAVLSSIFVATAISVFLYVLVDRWPSLGGRIQQPDFWNGGTIEWLRLLLIPLLAFALSPKFDAWFLSGRFKGLITAFAVFLFAAFLALKPGLAAGFGPTDDHELVEWLAGRERVPLGEWVSILMSTDFGAYGEGSSFRPLYYVFRVSEACLFGSNVAAWYGARIFYCAVTMLLLWVTAKRFLGATLAFWFAFAILGVPSSSEIFSRLGVGETFVMPFFALGICGMVELLRSTFAEEPKRLPAKVLFLRAWLPAAIGLAMIAGIKEVNLLVSGLGWFVGALVYFFSGRKSEKNRSILALHTVWAVWLGFMAIGIYKLVQGMEGSDLYGNEVVGLEALKAAIGAGVSGFAHLAIVFAFLAVVALTIVIVNRVGVMPSGKIRGLLKEHREWFCFILILLLAWALQALAYRDTRWLVGERYDGPAVVIFVMLTVGVVGYVAQRLAGSEDRNVFLSGQILRFVLLTSLMFSSAAGINRVHARTVESSRMTRDFSEWIGAIESLAKENPDRTIIFVPDKAFQHYEPMASTAKFLRVSGVTNSICFVTEFIEETSGVDGRMLEAMRSSGYGHAELIDGEAWPLDSIVVPFGSEALTSLKEQGVPSMETT